MSLMGIIVGLALLAAVTACAGLLARKANASVKAFRPERHERFGGRQTP